MVAIVEPPLNHMVLQGISWETFERLLDEMGERHFRMSYDNGDLEFMPLSYSYEHENYGKWIARLIFFVALELQMPIASGGSTTLKQGLRRKGLEPDECFWIQHESAMRGKKKWTTLNNLPPDLAVEIDITSSWLDHLGIYAALQVPEVWRFDGETLRVLIFGANGKYREKSKSAAFPTLSLVGFTKFITKLGSKDEVSLIQEFTAWLRAEVVGKTGRKNGKK
jgi:Uma2 family endonuclease